MSSARPVVMDEEAYLAANGASRMGLGDSALHKNIPYGRVRERLVDRQSALDQQLRDKRERLREEYYKKVETGEIRRPTRIERLIQIANGHPDNESVQAARRLLEKRGVSWD